MEHFVPKIFKNDKDQEFVGRIGSGFSNQMTATRVASDINVILSCFGVNAFCRVEAEEID